MGRSFFIIDVFECNRYSEKKKNAVTWFYASVVDWILSCIQKWRRINLSLRGVVKVDYMLEKSFTHRQKEV